MTAGDPDKAVFLTYRLAEPDVRRFVARDCSRSWACQARAHKPAMALLAALGLGLVGLCLAHRGVRPALLAGFTTVAVVVLLAWWREASAQRLAGRAARDLGLPCDLRLAISPLGIAKAPGSVPEDPGRRFGWLEVVAIERCSGLLVFRLRPAHGILIVPGRAFAGPEGLEDLERRARGWHRAATGRRD